jgi:hypothetical protein
MKEKARMVGRMREKYKKTRKILKEGLRGRNKEGKSDKKKETGRRK